ncbi:hypothetical protein PLICRDRAFT_174887 [Plicaturopsis crispa FD-325 SS-3]|nr:hypothetical protein PLICRDRAFT_174887 [Plicaturopsis crispa FD-325 SS-3]
MPDNVVIETAVISSLRFVLFFSCRKYLLRSLYHDLQDLSSDTKVTVSTQSEVPSSTSQRIDASGDSDYELDSLPAPNTQAKSHDVGVKGKKGSLHSVLARTAFSVCFSECCIMFLMLMAQGMDTFDPRTRILNWKVSLFLLLATILVFIPLSLSLILTLGSSSGPGQKRQRPILVRLLLYLSPVAVYFFMLSYIPLPSALSYPDVMTAALTRLIVLGTIILGLLSGFGAVSNAWAFFPLFSRNRKEPTDGDIHAAEQALLRIRHDLSDRQIEIQRRKSVDPKDSSWFSRVTTTFRGGDDHEQELKGLEALEYQMARNLEALKHRREYARFSESFKGTLFNWGGRLFAVYCVFRVISSIVNLLRPTRSATSYPDLITHFLAYLVSLLPSTNIRIEDVAVLSRQISLGLVGIIILSSVRLVLRGVTRALRVTSRNLGASLMVLILAQLMGIYLLSTVVQLRSSFPPPASRPDLDAVAVNLFSTIPEYEVFGSLFDWTFLLSACATAFVRWAGDRVNSAGID